MFTLYMMYMQFFYFICRKSTLSLACFSIAAQVEDILTRMIMRVMIMIMLMSMHMHTHWKIFLWGCLYYVSISY